MTTTADRLIAFINYRIPIRSGSLTIVIIQHPAQALSPPDCALLAFLQVGRNDQAISQSLVVAFAMVQLSNTTPILLTFVKSAIRGIHGMAGQCGCMPVS